MDQQRLVQHEGIQLQPLSSAYTRHAYARVPSQVDGVADSEGYHDNAGMNTTIASEAPREDPTTAKSRPESRSSSLTSQPGGRRRGQRFLSTWWLELSACFISIAAILVLTGVLYCYKNKPSPDWPNWLSLNTIVSIFTTVLKTAVLLIVAQGLGQLKWSWFAEGTAKPLQDMVKYDDASRGPFGSLKLLWRLKLSHTLSSFAALITVLAVATDPFGQQVIRYYDCSVPVPGGFADLPRTNYYYQYGGRWTQAEQVSIVPGIQRAINAGLFYPSLVPPVSCATGNCTWEQEYSTVGWCSQCEDISDQVTITNTTLEANITTSTGNVPILGNLTTSLPCDGCLSITSPLISKDILTGPMDEDGNLNDVEQMAAMGPSGKWNYQSVDFLLGYTSFGTSDPATNTPRLDFNTAQANQTLWKCKGYGAARCSINPCVKTFNASVKAGKLTETLLDANTDWSPSGTNTREAFVLDTKCVNTDERAMLIKEGYVIDPTQRWLPYNLTSSWIADSDGGVSLYNDSTFPGSMANRSCIYGMSALFRENFAPWFVKTLTGVVTGPAPATEATLGTFQGAQQLLTIYDYGNVSYESVSQAFENISISLTNYMRQNGVQHYSVPATGIVQQYKTCVAIRWPWLSYSAALVALTLCFFVLMVAQSWPSQNAERQNSPGIFKSSPLPLLYHGLWHSEGTLLERNHDTADMADLKSMEELASNTTVKFNSGSHGGVARLEIQEVREE